MRISHLYLERYMSHPSHPLDLGHPNNIWWSAQIMKLLMMQSSPFSFYFFSMWILFHVTSKQTCEGSRLNPASNSTSSCAPLVCPQHNEPYRCHITLNVWNCLYTPWTPITRCHCS
jgi:hypothetical protein